MDSLSMDSGEAVCEAFTPHFFKPSHCIHCFKRKAAHSITMPSQQSTLNGHRREVQESRKLSLGSVNAKASLWIKAARSKDPNIESSGSAVKVHRKPVLRSCFGPQTNMLSSTDSKLCHTKGSSSNVQNTYHPYPVMRNPPSTKGQVNMKVNGANGHNASLESKSVSTIHSTNGQVSNTNGDLNHNATESNLYEAIYPSDENIEDFDNQANMILENNKISQRSLSDAASYRKQNKQFVRRTSTPASAIPESGPYPNVLEFQKLAGRLKHTGRRDGSVSAHAGVEADNHTQVTQQKKRVPPSSCGYSRVEKPKDLAKKNTPVISEIKEQNVVTSQSKRNAKKLHTSHNGLTHLDKGYHQSSASSTSSGELRCDELSKSRSSSVNSCTSAPAVPVRTESKRRSKESGGKPGFALDSLLPDTITIISADGTKEVVTADGIFQTSAKDSAKVEVQTTEQCSDTAVTDRVTRKLSSQKGLPNDNETEINTPLSSILSSGSDVSYEVINIGPLSGSQQSDPILCERTKDDDCRPAAEDPECNSMAGKVSKEEVTPSVGQDSIPPFPVILYDSSEHKPKNRNSGNYKVPIFIKHQDYDNLGTVLADQDYEAMQLQQPEEETTGETPSESQVCDEDLEDQYYLKPTNLDDANGGAETASDAVNEDEYELVSHTPSGKMFSSEEEKSEAEVENPVGTPKRTRSKSHPMFCKEGHLVSGVLPFPSPTNKSKMKRTAPRPPEFSKEDTMPRTPPPPPPTDESRRLSKDLQEGILRYHRSAQASKGNFQVMKGSELGTCIKSQMQLGNSTSGHLSISGEKESVKVNQEKQTTDRKAVEKASPTDRKQKDKLVLHVSTSKGKSAPKPLISPPKAHLLQQLHLSDSPPSHSFHESRQKEKKSLLFWKKRKRKDEGGSPEREYNTEIVTKWLENLDELTPLTQRRSWERMEVINAYKGQETAVIGYKGQTEEHNAKDAVYPVDHVCSGKRKAPKHPRETISSSDSTSQTSPKPVERKNSKESLRRPPEKARDDCSNATKSSDERHQDVPSLPVKPPPRTKSQRRRRETVHESPEYVNLAFLKQSMTPPAKPRRRGRTTRSLTTGFENLPSTTKRIAPKAPEDATPSGKAEFLSNSDPESTANDLNDALSGAAPLKSALKKKSSEQIASGSADVPPKRPVRLIHANAEPMENHHFGLPKTGYVNLEVKQIDFGKENEDTPGSQEAEIVLDQIQSLQRQSFAQLGELYPISALTKELFVGRSLEDFLIHERTLTFSDEETFCFRAELKEGSDSFGFMVFLQQTCQEKVYEAAKEMEAFPPHPNLLNVVHTFKAALPSHLFTESQDEASQAESEDSPSDQRNAVVVITSQVPTSSAAHFIQESKSRGGECDETYETEVLDMILQICRGLAHAEEQEPSKSLEGLKQDSVLQMGKGSRIWLFNPLVVETLSSSVPGRRASVVSHLTDKCCEFDLGILIYELLHQANPFAVRTSLMCRNYVPEDLPVLPEKSPHSARLMGLVCELLRRCPEERASAYEAVCIIFAQKFCESVSSGASVLRTKFDSHGLRQLITMKQAELMCSLVSQLSGDSVNKFGISEKLEFVFWSEVDCLKLKKGLTKAQEMSTINAQTE